MRIYIPDDDRFGYKACYACGTIRSSIWHANRHYKQKQIILHYLCQQCYDHIIYYPQRYAEPKRQFENQEVEMTTCACGCGKTFPKYNRFGAEKKYYWASHVNNDVKRSMFKKRVFIQCRCGCGEYTRHYLERGNQTIYYINGHHARIMKEEGNRIIHLNCPVESDQRHAILSLYGYLKANGCAVNDAICKGSKQLFLVPLDGNHYNTDIENFVVLCGSHKMLKHTRKLTSLAEILAIKHTFYDQRYGAGAGKRRRWYTPAEVPGIEMRKVLSEEQGHFRGR